VCGHGDAPGGVLAWCLPGQARRERAWEASVAAGGSSCGRGAKRMGLAVGGAGEQWGKGVGGLAGLSFMESGG
jgi:hypothetical protein